MAHDNSDDDGTTLDRELAITTRQTSEILGYAEITLAQKRARGEGPRFFRIGRSIRYRLGDVLDFRDAHTVGKRVRP
jgi:hypothetical protein